MHIICSDLEGVWVPEVWINVALKTGIEKLRYTTRDIKDYDELMQHRLKILKEHHLKLQDIQDVIATIKPLDGALQLMKWIREVSRLIVVSDTFVEFADPLMRQLDRPTLFCHSLVTDTEGNITGYTLRQKDPKKKVVQALKSMNFEVIAFGDSYNDISMLKEADKAILFKPPANVQEEFPQFPVAHEFDKLKQLLVGMMK